MNDTRNNVVVTGLGVLSALGFGKDEFFKNLCDGKDATARITSVNPEGFRKTNAVEIRQPLPQDERFEGYGRAMKMALLAVKEALDDSAINPNLYKKDRMGVSIGTMVSGAGEIEKWYCDNKGAKPENEQRDLINQFTLQSMADTIACEYNISGPRNSVMTACASGTVSIGIGYRWIQRGRADAVVCGGVDAFRFITHLGLSIFRAVSHDKVRPFDANRKGTLIGEGAGILILESEESARKRGAKIYCRVLGYGSTCDADDLAHPHADGLGMSCAIEKAIEDSGLDKGSIGYINAHGTGTEKNDIPEAEAIRKVFTNSDKKPCVSSIKGAIGHTSGAAGGIEALATVLSIYHKKAPPTVNVLKLDSKCVIDIVLDNARDMDIKAAISNSFGFGGNNACILFGEV